MGDNRVSARKRQPDKYQYMGLMIERGYFGWYVFDWDFEGEGETLYTAPTQYAAEQYIRDRSV